MTLLAIPIIRINCRVGIDRGQVWSVVDQAILWGLFRAPRSISALVDASNLSRRIVITVLTRLMRYRLVEAVLADDGAIFQISKFGRERLTSGFDLPSFPQRSWKRVSIAIELLHGGVYRSRDLQIYSNARLQKLRKTNPSVRTLIVSGGTPSVDAQSNLEKIAELAALQPDEHLAAVDGRASTLNSNQYMLINCTNGTLSQLPENASPILKRHLIELAGLPKEKTSVTVQFTPQGAEKGAGYQEVPCWFDSDDIVIGGSAQRALLGRLLGQAATTAIIQSTFLKTDKVEALFDELRSACRRGVHITLLWGGKKGEKTLTKNANATKDIQRLIHADPTLRGSVDVHPFSLDSHAKVIAVDRADGSWISAIGSCNWLSSPMTATDMTVVLREPLAVADTLDAVRKLVEREGEMAPLAANLAMAVFKQRLLPPSEETNATVRIVSGEAHDAIARQASGSPQSRFVMSSHRLGATARTGSLLPSITAGTHEGTSPIFIYTQKTGPTKARHERNFVEDATRQGVRVIKSETIPLHAKFLIWGDNDLMVTSLNWASSSSGSADPPGELGVHISAPGIAQSVVDRLERFICELKP